MSGQVQLLFDPLPASIGNIKAGKLKLLAISGATRHPRYPDVQTFAEAGLPDYTPSAWIGLMAPAGTPREIVARLNKEINEIIAEPAMKERLATLGYDAVGTTPEAFGTRIAEEIETWRKVIRAANIKVQ